MGWIDTYQDGGIIDERYESVKTKDVTDLKYKAPKKLSKEEIFRRSEAAKREKTGEIKAHEEQGWLDRTWEIATNPITAFGYAARNESLPQHFSRGERNTQKMALDMINPAYYLDQAGQAVSNLSKGEFVDAGLNTLGMLPLALEAKQIGKLARITSNKELLSKTIRGYNPNTFKFNSEAYYRGVGKEGLDDILNKKILKSKKEHAYPDPYYVKGRDPRLYSKGYMAEVTNEPMKGVGAFKKGDLIQTTENPIFLDNPNLKLYKKHWWKGHKEIPKPSPEKMPYTNPTQKFSQSILSKEMEPFISKKGNVHFDSKGNRIPAPKEIPFKSAGGPFDNTYRRGGVIEDDRGQWAHPGKVTKINSNDITMKGVNYPVLGISNTGDEQMMMPGEDYKFDGESVTEYPATWLENY